MYNLVFAIQIHYMRIVCHGVIIQISNNNANNDAVYLF